MKHRSHIYKIIFVLVLTFGGLFFLTKDTFATNQTIIGFIIEANKMEGIMQNPTMTVGNTAEHKEQAMLKLTFENLSAEGLIIKKLVKTQKGLITIDMTHKDAALFNKLSLHVSNATFSEYYIPANGNIALKNVKLLAHFVATENSVLPQFSLSFNEGGKVEMEPKSEAELLQTKSFLEQLLTLKQE